MQLWKLSATTWINPVQIVEVQDHREVEEVCVKYAVGDGNRLVYHYYVTEERQALLDYLNNPAPEGFV